MADKEWSAANFSKRTYVLEDDDFGKKRIEVQVRLGTEVLAVLTLCEPGMISITSRPNDAGIQIDSVSPDGVRLLDIKTPGASDVQVLELWQSLALGL